MGKLGCRVRWSTRHPSPRLSIACIRLMPTLKTGLRMCPAEKRRDSDPFAAEQSVLCSPVCLGIIAKYGHLSRIAEGEEPTFSAVQTAWRSAQSGANLSPVKFPANRENNREFAKSCPLKPHSFSLSYTFDRRKYLCRRKSEQGINRDVTGRYQGIYLPDQGICCREIFWRARRDEIAARQTAGGYRGEEENPLASRRGDSRPHNITPDRFRSARDV